MLNLNEFVLWQNIDLSKLDKQVLLFLLFQEFNLNRIDKIAVLLCYFSAKEKNLHPAYNALNRDYKFHFPFILEYMKLAFEFFHDEINGMRNLLKGSDLNHEAGYDENELLNILKQKEQFENKIELKYTMKMFGSEILSKLDKVSLNDIKFDENYTVNGSIGKVKIGIDKDKKQVVVKINQVWRKSDIDLLRTFIEKQRSVPKHRNLIQVYKIGLDVRRRVGRRYEYAYFYSMEKADSLCDNGSYCSKTLANILTGQNLLPSGTIYLLKELAKGLKALHDSGKFHGKIRPENILWVDNVPKLSELTCAGDLNNPFTFKDTILPSEQKADLSIKSSVDSDIYALAICAYCALTGNSERMFPEMAFEILKTSEGKALNNIFLKACAKSKKTRYPSVDMFLKDLNKIDTSETAISFDKEYTFQNDKKIDVFTSVLGKNIMSKLDDIKLKDIKLKDYKVVKNFRGAGSFGDVRICESVTWEFIAIKRVNLNNPRARQEAESVLLYKEKVPDHPHLIKIFEVGCDTEVIDGEEENFFFYTMEAADNLFGLCYPDYRYYYPVSLQPLLYKEKKYNLSIRYKEQKGQEPEGSYSNFCNHILLKQLLEGIAALHDTGLVHRDIKPENLIFVNGVLKISDVGLVTTIDSIDSLAGTEGYLPPEYLKQSYINIQKLQEDAIKNDLFAAGISVFYNSIGSNSNSFAKDIEDKTNKMIEVFASFQANDYGFLFYNKVINKLCAINPENRFKSATDVLAEFPDDFREFFESPSELRYEDYENAKKQDAALFSFNEYEMGLLDFFSDHKK